MDLKTFEMKMLEELKKSSIIEHVVMGDVLDPFERGTIMNLLSQPCEILIEDGKLCAKDDEGQLIECPNYSFNLHADGKWLSNSVPPVPFDVDQNGNIRKGEEAEAAYCCIIVTLVLKDSVFSKELDEVINDYDFREMDGNIKGNNFKKLLSSWLDLQSSLVNVSVSAAKYNISNLKKDSQKFLRDGISEEAQAGLRNLFDKIKDINRRYSTGILSPNNVKNLNKIEILTQLQLKQTEISDLITQSEVGTLYKILNLSSEYVSPIVKKRLFNKVNSEVAKVFEETPELEIVIGDRKILHDRWKRRYIRLAKISLRKIEVEKYLKEPSSYQLPSKL